MNAQVWLLCDDCGNWFVRAVLGPVELIDFPVTAQRAAALLKKGWPRYPGSF